MKRTITQLREIYDNATEYDLLAQSLALDATSERECELLSGIASDFCKMRDDLVPYRFDCFLKPSDTAEAKWLEPTSLNIYEKISDLHPALLPHHLLESLSKDPVTGAFLLWDYYEGGKIWEKVKERREAEQ